MGRTRGSNRGPPACEAGQKSARAVISAFVPSPPPSSSPKSGLVAGQNAEVTLVWLLWGQRWRDLPFFADGSESQGGRRGWPFICAGLRHGAQRSPFGAVINFLFAGRTRGHQPSRFWAPRCTVSPRRQGVGPAQPRIWSSIVTLAPPAATRANRSSWRRRYLPPPLACARGELVVFLFGPTPRPLGRSNQGQSFLSGHPRT